MESMRYVEDSPKYQNRFKPYSEISGIANSNLYDNYGVYGERPITTNKSTFKICCIKSFCIDVKNIFIWCFLPLVLMIASILSCLENDLDLIKQIVLFVGSAINILIIIYVYINVLLYRDQTALFINIVLSSPIILIKFLNVYFPYINILTTTVVFITSFIIFKVCRYCKCKCVTYD